MQIEIIPEPGTYGDGPVFVRIHRGRAGTGWRIPGYRRATTGPLSRDAEHDYVEVENSHTAYVFQRWLRRDGLATDALAVVRLRS